MPGVMEVGKFSITTAPFRPFGLLPSWQLAQVPISPGAPVLPLGGLLELARIKTLKAMNANMYDREKRGGFFMEVRFFEKQKLRDG